MSVNLIKEKLEKFLDSETTSAKATKIILAVLAVAGILTIAVMAPNVFQIFGKYKCARKYPLRNLRQATYRLRKQGLIEIIKEKDNSLVIRLTKNGKTRVKELALDNLTIPKPKKWDKKWRLVIFDIPNKYKPAREALRKKLKELGFYQLQKSVWAYPFSCEDEILFISHVFNVERFIEILTVERLLHKDKLRKYFKI